MGFADDGNVQYDLEEFSKVEYALRNRASFDLYIEHKLRGETSLTALMAAFGYEYATDMVVAHRIYLLEANPYFVENFDRRLGELALSKLWSPARSAYNLIQLARNADKENVKLAAIKELNVIFGITTVDDAGRTRATRRLDDFYRDVALLEPGADIPVELEGEDGENPSSAGQGEADEQ